MAERVFLEKLLEVGKQSLCKRHLFKGLSEHSCLVDLCDIEKTLSKH